jgi:hypothetical protein
MTRVIIVVYVGVAIYSHAKQRPKKKKKQSVKNDFPLYLHDYIKTNGD